MFLIMNVLDGIGSMAQHMVVTSLSVHCILTARHRFATLPTVRGNAHTPVVRCQAATGGVSIRFRLELTM